MLDALLPKSDAEQKSTANKDVVCSHGQAFEYVRACLNAAVYKDLHIGFDICIRGRVRLIFLRIDGKTKMVAGAVSSCLPPWFEIQIASTPQASAKGMSSGLMTPLRIIFKLVWLLIHLMSYHDMLFFS